MEALLGRGGRQGRARWAGGLVHGERVDVTGRGCQRPVGEAPLARLDAGRDALLCGGRALLAG